MKRTLVIAMMLVAPGLSASQEIAAEVSTAAGTLHGTLLLPANAGQPMPVALIIAGSGPTDRDGNTPLLPGKNNSLKLIAEALAANGVASLRYDKRGIGASMGVMLKESDLRFTNYVDDAVAWIEQLRSDPRFSRVMVVGHSEGSLIGILAAQRITVDRVISLAGAGRAATVVLQEQLSRALAGQLLDDARRVMAELKAGRTVTDPPAQLAALFRPSVQPYLISWVNIDPAMEVGRLRMPVLVVQGTTDIQISVADAERLAKGSPTAVLETIDGMNHVLKEVRESSQQVASYSDSTLKLHPRLVELLKRFTAQ